MKHLLSATKDWQKVLRNSFLFIFMDYDGTLTPICDKPWQAKLADADKKTLRDLAAFDELRIAIVSGRSIHEVKKLVGIPGITYVGNHGLEIEGPNNSYTCPDALAKEQLFSEIAGLLKKVLRMRGIIIENKRYSVTVHYRLLAHDYIEKAKGIFLQTIKPYLNKNRVIMTEGKKVWEVRPERVWNKGSAVLWILARWMAHSDQKVFPIYIGDDQTDEDAFCALAGMGMNVKVTSNIADTTAAEFFLLSPKEVFDFLKSIQDLKKDKQSADKNRVRVGN